MKNILRASALLLALTVAGAACASDDPETTEDGSTTVAADEGGDTGTSADKDADAMEEKDGDAMEEKDTAAEPETVVAIAESTGQHKTLVAALGKAELVEALQAEGPLTVFAPTDAAFETYLTDAGITADELLENEALADILKGHVVSGEIKAEAITETAVELDTLAGTKIEAVITDEKATVGGAEVSGADNIAGNGVVHVIDSVIAPAE